MMNGKRKKQGKSNFNDDMDLLRGVVRQLLLHIQASLEREEQADVLQKEYLQERHARLFGAKASVAGVLLTLAELITRLNSSPAGTEEGAAMLLSDADMALLEGHIGKLRDANAS